MCYPPNRTRTKGLAVILLVTASLVASGSAAFAQDRPDDGHVRGTVALRLDEGPLHAAVRRAGAGLTPGPALTAQTRQQSSWVVRHPVVTGALIGAGGGAVLSRTRAIGGANHDPRVALIGAGAGAWAGLVAAAVHKTRSGEKVGVGTKIGIAAGAVGIIVLPLLACYGAGGCGGVS
jgi:hypothetical protein